MFVIRFSDSGADIDHIPAGGSVQDSPFIFALHIGNTDAINYLANKVEPAHVPEQQLDWFSKYTGRE